MSLIKIHKKTMPKVIFRITKHAHSNGKYPSVPKAQARANTLVNMNLKEPTDCGNKYNGFLKNISVHARRMIFKKAPSFP
jgi:hypothetical protein